MKALISPYEVAYNDKGEDLGQRVADVCAEAFEVASPLFWVDCPPDCIADQWYYLDGAVLQIPTPPPPPELPEPPPVDEDLDDHTMEF